MTRPALPDPTEIRPKKLAPFSVFWSMLIRKTDKQAAATGKCRLDRRANDMRGSRIYGTDTGQLSIHLRAN